MVEAAQQSNGHAPVEEAEDQDPDDVSVSDEKSIDPLEPGNASNDDGEHQEEGIQDNNNAHKDVGEGNQTEGVRFQAADIPLKLPSAFRKGMRCAADWR